MGEKEEKYKNIKNKLPNFMKAIFKQKLRKKWLNFIPYFFSNLNFFFLFVGIGNRIIVTHNRFS